MTQKLDIAVQMDSLDIVDIDADTTFALMLAAQERGHKLWHYEVTTLQLRDVAGQVTVGCIARPVHLRRELGNHYSLGNSVHLDLACDVDVVLMRQHPPFDMAYITATHILEHIHPRTLVVNDPRSVRNAPEKLLVTHFPDLMPPTLVTWDVAAMRAFRAQYSDIIIKPLYVNRGEGILRIRPDDQNFSSLLEMHFARSREPLMLQRYEPAVRQGDKRILLIDGEPVGGANRVPASDEVRSNRHVGGRVEKSTLTPREYEICSRIGPTLREQGLLLAGIDVIGNWLTEINVTSPSGVQEIGRFDGIDLAAQIIKTIEIKVVESNRS